MKYFFWFCAIIITTYCKGQKSNLDSLVSLVDKFYLRQLIDSLNTESYDSFIIICKEIKSASLKVSKNENINFYLADFYYKTRKYNDAIKLSKNFLKKPMFERPSRISFFRNVDRRQICYNLSSIYLERKDYQKSLKYLLKIEKKYNKYWCCMGTCNGRKIELYQKIIGCYTVLRNVKKVEIYKKKLEDIET